MVDRGAKAPRSGLGSALEGTSDKLINSHATNDARAHQERADKSVPRTKVRGGDASIDRRGRVRAAHPFLSYGFRPFFLGASVYAAIAVPIWLWMFLSGTQAAGPFSGVAWHAHEMIFGYLGAVMAGFILTAIPNWTGRLPLSGAPLAVLFALWVAGRVACSTVSEPIAALVLDLAFPTMLSAAIWREVIAGKNWRNAPVALLLTLFASANLLHHLGAFWPDLAGVAVRLALGVAALLIALVGGRIVPSFTRNWLVKQGARRLPASFGRVDRVALASVAAAVLAWNVAPYRQLSGMLLSIAGLLLGLRLARWRGPSTWREPVVLVLHLGYGWLAVALVMLGWSILTPDVMPQSSALHALTAGAIATMTLAVMTRATLGHTGRAVETDAATLAIYLMVDRRRATSSSRSASAVSLHSAADGRRCRLELRLPPVCRSVWADAADAAPRRVEYWGSQRNAEGRYVRQFFAISFALVLLGRSSEPS